MGIVLLIRLRSLAGAVTPQPLTLQAIGQVSGPTQAVAVEGRYAYVGIGLRLVVLDISNPAELRAVISFGIPPAAFHDYLRRIVEAGFGRRVLFGSDQMVWPDAIEVAIRSIETAEFLDQGQKATFFTTMPPASSASVRTR